MQTITEYSRWLVRVVLMGAIFRSGVNSPRSWIKEQENRTQQHKVSGQSFTTDGLGLRGDRAMASYCCCENGFSVHAG